MKQLGEVFFIIIALAGAGLFIDQWPTSLRVGQFILMLCTVFFVQTLLRDLYLIISLREDKKSNELTREGQCFCLESGLGMLVLVIGIFLLLTNLGGQIQLDKSLWIMILAGLMTFNYCIRDFVFSWNPWRIYRDANHLNIIPKW